MGKSGCDSFVCQLCHPEECSDERSQTFATPRFLQLCHPEERSDEGSQPFETPGFLAFGSE